MIDPYVGLFILFGLFVCLCIEFWILYTFFIDWYREKKFKKREKMSEEWLRENDKKNL